MAGLRVKARDVALRKLVQKIQPAFTHDIFRVIADSFVVKSVEYKYGVFLFTIEWE